MTHAQAVLDDRLAQAPEQFGEELSEGLMACEVGPLRAYFEIHPQDRLVKVTGVTRSRS